MKRGTAEKKKKKNYQSQGCRSLHGLSVVNQVEDDEYVCKGMLLTKIVFIEHSFCPVNGYLITEGVFRGTVQRKGQHFRQQPVI